jgi:hypothetical protein
MIRDNINDTIAAISTAVGESGIGIVRMSGKDALEIADKIFVSKEGKKSSTFKTYTKIKNLPPDNLKTRAGSRPLPRESGGKKSKIKNLKDLKNLLTRLS